MEKKDLVITISGPHGVGKSALAKVLSQNFGLKYISSGEMFRREAKKLNLNLSELSELTKKDPKIDKSIDENMVNFTLNRGVIADGLLTGWLLKNKANIKIFLTAPLEVRVSRIAKRDNVSISYSKNETVNREHSEKLRFINYYDIDLDCLDVYDVILNTSLIQLDSMIQILNFMIKSYMEEN